MPSKSVSIKELEVISDPNTIKTLFEPTRSAIVFRYLVNGAMTVKQLADALNKNPGTILHHIEKLKKLNLVFEHHTENTVTGIVQRYYRASAREYRLGIGQMMGADNGVSKFAQNRLISMISSLAVYGLSIPKDKHDEAIKLLREFIERENNVISNIPIVDQEAYSQMSEPVRRDAARIFRRYSLDHDPEYQDLKTKWYHFLQLFL